MLLQTLALSQIDFKHLLFDPTNHVSIIFLKRFLIPCFTVLSLTENVAARSDLQIA